MLMILKTLRCLAEVDVLLADGGADGPNLDALLVQTSANGFCFFVRELHHVFAVDVADLQKGNSVPLQPGDLAFQAVIRFVCECA